MTIVSPVSASAAPASSNGLAELSGNFDTFLQLLTTQLQNQDPMAPMDSNQFTQELVEFSGVEQQINTNDNLQTLIAQGQNSSAFATVGFLGKSVTITNGNAALQNGDAKWSYALGADAANTTLTVTNAAGQAVFTQAGETGSGQHDFEWNGEDSNGNQLPDGVYTLSVTANGADGSQIQTAVASTGIVDEVNMVGQTPLLMIGQMAVPISAIATIGDGTN